MFWMMESQSHEVAKTHAERGTKKQEKTTQVLVLLEPEEVSRAARRAKPNYFDLVLGHDAAAVAAARGKASAPFAHGGTWVPRAVWAAPPRRKAPKASLVCGALPRPNTAAAVRPRSSRRGRVDGVNINVTFGRETQPRLVADDEAAAPPTYDVCSMA